MGFYLSAPWFLAGLSAVAVPFLLLLTRAAAREKVFFSSVYFLKAVTLAARQRLEWKRLLLLALRVLGLIFLAAAFTRPFRHSHQPFWADRDRENQVFFLDTSASMKYAEGGTNSWAKALQKIHNQASQAGRASYSLFTFDHSVQPVMQHERSRRRFFERLDALAPSDAAANFATLAQSLKSACGFQSSAKRCFVVSDFYMPHESAARLDQVQWLSVRPAHFRNFYLKKMLLPPRPLVAGREETISIFYGSAGSSGTEITLWADGEKMDSRKIDLVRTPEGVVDFQCVFSKAGPVRLRVQSSGDGLPSDDDWKETVQVQEPLQVLLIRAQEPAYAFQSPDFYLVQALLSSDTGSEAKNGIQFIRKSPEAAGQQDLAGYNFVFVTDEVSLPGRLLTQLRYFMKNGGTVIFLPAAAGQTAQDSTAFSLTTQFFGGRMQDPEIPGESRNFHWGPVDYAEPLFQAFDYGRQGSLENIKIHRFRPYLDETQGGAKVLLWINGRWPGLVERTVGTGRLFIWTVGLTPDWSDLPRDPLFVPLLLEFLKYAGRMRNPLSLYAEAGMPVEIFTSAAAGLKRLQVKLPDGNESFLYPDHSGKFLLQQTQNAGRYEWQDGARLNQIVIRVPQRESNPPKRAALRDLRPDTVVKTPAGEPAAVRKNYFHPFCFSGVLACLLLESLVAARLYRTAAPVLS